MVVAAADRTGGAQDAFKEELGACSSETERTRNWVNGHLFARAFVRRRRRTCVARLFRFLTADRQRKFGVARFHTIVGERETDRAFAAEKAVEARADVSDKAGRHGERRVQCKEGEREARSK